jgi:hypothetical protein
LFAVFGLAQQERGKTFDETGFTRWVHVQR